MDSDKEPSLWPLAFLGIFVSALALLSSQRKNPAKTVYPQDTSDDKGGYVQKECTLSHANAIKTDRGKDEPSKRDWVRISAIAQACAIPLGFGLLAVNIYQMHTMRQQLVGTQGAVMEFRGTGFGVEFPNVSGSGVLVKNIGHVPAKKVHFSFRVLRVTLPTEQPIELIADVKFSQPRFLPAGEGDINVWTHEYPFVVTSQHAGRSEDRR